MTTKTTRECGTDEEETVMALDTEKLLEQASQAVREAGELFARRDMAGHIRQKGATDFVTQVDLEVQSMLQKRLAEIAPEVQFMGRSRTTPRWTCRGRSGCWTRWTAPPT